MIIKINARLNWFISAEVKYELLLFDVCDTPIVKPKLIRLQRYKLFVELPKIWRSFPLLYNNGASQLERQCLGVF